MEKALIYIAIAISMDCDDRDCKSLTVKTIISFSMFTRSYKEGRLEDCAANRWKIAIVYALVCHSTIVYTLV